MGETGNRTGEDREGKWARGVLEELCRFERTGQKGTRDGVVKGRLGSFPASPLMLFEKDQQRLNVSYNYCSLQDGPSLPLTPRNP